MAVTGMIVGKSFVTLMINGATKTVTEGQKNYSEIREAVRVKDMDLVEKLIDAAAQVANYMAGKISITNGQVFYGAQQLHGAVVDRIVDMMTEGFDHEPMVKFVENLMSNPSKRAVDELYTFLEQTALPITEDGHFLAYKKVRDDYKDLYSGTMDNSVGKVLEMPRNGVDEDKDRTCSAGLHFCSLSYLKHYYGGSGRVMIVKINPADVVAIPSDYNNAKGRACKYEIISEHTSEIEEAFDKPVYSDKHFEDVEDNWLDNEGDENWDWDDENSNEPSDPADLNEAYDEGYEEGVADADRGYEYDDSNAYLDDMRAAYRKGYKAGYATGEDEKDNPAVQQGGLVGYNQGRKDAAAGLRYNDNPAAHAIVVSDLEAYQSAYNKGWNSIKITQ